MKDSGAEVGRGECITILAKGTINTCPLGSSTIPTIAMRTTDQYNPEGFTLGPKRLLLIFE